jgi:hypothetical protein
MGAGFNMKKLILTGLLLMAVGCVAPVFGQEKTEAATEIIEFRNIKIPADKKEAFLAAFLRPLLSRQGSVESDAETQKFNFTDSPNRLRLIRDFTGLLDNSGFRVNDLLAKSANEKRKISEAVQTTYLYPVLWCDVGEELRLAKLALQENLLVRMLAEINVRGEKYANLETGSGLNLTGNRKRVALAKKFIALFDAPILTEQNDF